MNALNNINVNNIYNKTKNFLNTPVDSVIQFAAIAGAFIPALASTATIVAIMGIMIAVMASIISHLEAELVYLITYIPTYDLVQDPFNENGFTGSSIYYSFLLLRDLSLYVFLFVFGILGVLILLENLNIAGMNMNKIKDTFKTTFIALIIIMIFPVLWDGFAESASKASLWILNPLYNLDNLDKFNYCVIKDADDNIIKQIPKTTRTGCYYEDEDKVLPLHNIIDGQKRCIDQVYQATAIYDTPYDIDNDNIASEYDKDIIFIHRDKHIQTILNDNWNMYQKKYGNNDKDIIPNTGETEIHLANLKTEPSLNITNERDMKGDFTYGLLAKDIHGLYKYEDQKVYEGICDPGLRISYVYHRAYNPTRTEIISIGEDFNWENEWKKFTIGVNDKFRELVDWMFFRPLFVTVLFMASIGIHVAMYARLFVTEFIMAGFPLFVALSLLLRPFAQKVSATLEETFVIAPIPLLIMPFFVGLVFFIGSLTLFNGETNLITTGSYEVALDNTGIPGLADRGFGLWLQGLMIVTFAALIPALFLPFLKQFDTLTKKIGDGLTRSMVAMNAAMTSMAVGGMKGAQGGGMNMGGSPPIGGAPSSGGSPPSSGESPGDNTNGMGNTKSGDESGTTGGTSGNQNMGLGRASSMITGAVSGLISSLGKQGLGYEMQSMGGGSGTSDISNDLKTMNKTIEENAPKVDLKIDKNPNTPNKGPGPSTYHDDKS